MTKFVIGILCAAAGFGLMMLAAQNVLSNGGAGVSPLAGGQHPDADAR